MATMMVLYGAIYVRQCLLLNWNCMPKTSRSRSKYQSMREATLQILGQHGKLETVAIEMQNTNSIVRAMTEHVHVKTS